MLWVGYWTGREAPHQRISEETLRWFHASLWRTFGMLRPSGVPCEFGTLSIWEYADTALVISRDVVESSSCIFCLSKLQHVSRVKALEPKSHSPGCSTLQDDRTEIGLCQNCGWWTARRHELFPVDIHSSGVTISGSYGVLRNLDFADADVPLQELRDFLAAHHHRRYCVHQKAFEQVVASIYRDHGYVAEHTGRSGDGGVDILLFDSRSGDRIGIQVKRYKGAIEAESIRSLVGALVLKGLTQGVFVTTSRFRSGAASTAQHAADRGIAIRLVDAAGFYSALRIAQRRVRRSAEEWYSMVNNKLARLSHKEHVEPYYLK
jgi:restriction system protein